MSPKASPMPSLMTLPGSMNPTATTTATTRRTPPCSERTKLAGASGTCRNGVPPRMRSIGSVSRAMKRMTVGTDRVSVPCTGVEAQNPVLGHVAHGVGGGEPDDERARGRSWAGCAGGR